MPTRVYWQYKPQPAVWFKEMENKWDLLAREVVEHSLALIGPTDGYSIEVPEIKWLYMYKFHTFRSVHFHPPAHLPDPPSNLVEGLVPSGSGTSDSPWPSKYSLHP